MSRQSDLVELTRKKAQAISSGSKNLIINGDMQVAQRGDTATNVSTNGVKTVDRFNLEGGSYDAFDLSVSTGPSGFPRALKVYRNSAVAAASGSEYALISQTIEAQNLQHLKYGTADAQPITISFWVKSTATGTYALNLYANDTGSVRTATKNYTIDAANTWEHKSVTFEGDPSGQINNDNGAGLWIQWFLRAGSNYTGTQSPTWSAHTAAQYADGHDADFMSAANGSWELTGVQCEVGREVTDFEHIPYSDQLTRCQRYYQICVDTHYRNFVYNVHRDPIPLKVTMRGSPTLTVNHTGSAGPTTGVETWYITQNSMAMAVSTTAAGFGAGSNNLVDIGNITLKADAEL